MLESDAKQKWCPLIRVNHAYYDGNVKLIQAAVNSFGNVEVDAYDFKCRGSACMMWRWNAVDGNVNQLGVRHMPTERDQGYCGIAGHPNKRFD